MRIALVIERFEPGGGMETVAWQVARGLANAGDEVHVIARRAVPAPGVELHLVQVRNHWMPLRLAVFARRAARAAAGRFDVVHAFSRVPKQDIYRAGGGSHADYMKRVYGPAGASLRRLAPRHALLLGIEQQLFADASQVVQCGSRMVRDELARRFRVPRGRLVVIHNGVDCERFRPADGPRSERAALPAGPATDAPVWLFAGSGWRRKGIDTAMRALAASTDSLTRLWIAGGDRPGRWQTYAQQLGISSRVDFLGPREDLERIYRAADALLLPTRYDAFANVCLEAAASGLPVVTSRHNGSSELLGGAGIVIADAEDVAGFADALDRLTDASLRRRLGARGRELAMGHSWIRHIEKLRTLYARVRS